MALLDKLKITPQKDEENPDEFAQQFAADPEPGEQPGTTKERKVGPTRRRTAAGSAKLAREVAEDLATLLEGAAAVWSFSDQCCAPVLAEQARPISQALTTILARNPRLLAAFKNTDIVSYTLQSVALGRALAPVGKAVYNNHVSKAVEVEEVDNGGDTIHLGAFPAFSGIDRSANSA